MGTAEYLVAFGESGSQRFAANYSLLGLILPEISAIIFFTNPITSRAMLKIPSHIIN